MSAYGEPMAEMLAGVLLMGVQGGGLDSVLLGAGAAAAGGAYGYITGGCGP